MHINQLYTFKTCIFIHKVLNKTTHSQLSFTKKQQKYNTRNANNLKLISHRTLYGKKSIAYEGAQLYNKLPKDIKNVKSPFIFKKLLKGYIYKNVTVIK